MYCEKCGYKLRRGVKSCAQCGAPTPYNRSRSVVLIIAAILLSISGIVAVFILDHGKALPVIIVDILSVAAILTGLFVGIRRGCLYGTVSTVLLAAVFAMSLLVSQTAAPLIYDSLIKDAIIGTVDEAVANSSPMEHVTDSDDEILSIIIGNNLFTSESVVASVSFISGEETASDAVDEIISEYFRKKEPVYDDNGKPVVIETELAKVVESRLFEPLIVFCLQIALFLILVLVLRFMMSLIMRIFRLLEGIHIPYALDIIFGTVEGVAGGAVWLCYAAVALEIVIIVILLFGGTFDTVINETIEDTTVFRLFYQTAGRL